MSLLEGNTPHSDKQGSFFRIRGQQYWVKLKPGFGLPMFPKPGKPFWGLPAHEPPTVLRVPGSHKSVQYPFRQNSVSLLVPPKVVWFVVVRLCWDLAPSPRCLGTLWTRQETRSFLRSWPGTRCRPEVGSHCKSCLMCSVSQDCVGLWPYHTKRTTTPKSNLSL